MPSRPCLWNLTPRRAAKELLYSTGIIQTEEERRGVNQVLNAAALTYVAGLVTAVMQLLYYVFLIGGMGGQTQKLSMTSGESPSIEQQSDLRSTSASQTPARFRGCLCIIFSICGNSSFILVLFLGAAFVYLSFGELESIAQTLQQGNFWFILLAVLIQFAWFLVAGLIFQSLYHVLGMKDTIYRLSLLAASANFRQHCCTERRHGRHGCFHQ